MSKKNRQYTWFSCARIHAVVDGKQFAAEQIFQAGCNFIAQELVTSNVLPAGNLLA